jgi:hypothetical protein
MMKFIQNFESYILNEAFDLNKLYKQQNIIPEIQKEAQGIVDHYFDAVDVIPVDMQRNREKVVLWIAKQIKAYVIDEMTKSINSYTRLKPEESDDYSDIINQITNKLNYYKGKVTNMSDDDMHRIVNSIEEFSQVTESDLQSIFDYFLSPMRNQHEPINLVTSTFEEMWDIQFEWHRKLKATDKILNESGNIIKEFSDGYYWIDLQTNSSEEEGRAMGHCGTTRADTILSLRKKSDAGHIQPYVSIAVDYDGTNTKYTKVYQIKGKGNTKPIEKYHSYIVELLLDDTIGIENLENSEYLPQNDFHISDLKDKSKIMEVFKAKPNLFCGSRDYALLFVMGVINRAYILKQSKNYKLYDYMVLLVAGVIKQSDVKWLLINTKKFSFENGSLYYTTQYVNEYRTIFSEHTHTKNETISDFYEWCLKHKDVDTEKLKKVVHNNIAMVFGVDTIEPVGDVGFKIEITEDIISQVSKSDITLITFSSMYRANSQGYRVNLSNSPHSSNGIPPYVYAEYNEKLKKNQ